MARKHHHKERPLRVRSVRKDPPDLKKLAGALIALAQAQAEADAEAEHHHEATKPKQPTKPNRNDEVSS